MGNRYRQTQSTRHTQKEETHAPRNQQALVLLLYDEHVEVVVEQPVPDAPCSDDLLQSPELASTEDDEICLVCRSERTERLGGSVGVGDEEGDLALITSEIQGESLVSLGKGCRWTMWEGVELTPLALWSSSADCFSRSSAWDRIRRRTASCWSAAEMGSFGEEEEGAERSEVSMWAKAEGARGRIVAR